MANTHLTHAMIANEGLRRLKNTMVLGKKVHRGYDDEVGGSVNGHSKGDTVTIPVPPRYASVDGPDVTGQMHDITEGKRTLVLNRHKSVPVEFGTREMTLEIRDFGERFIQPAIDELVQNVETALFGEYKKIWNFTGTPGTVPSSFLELGRAGTILTNGSVPMGMRNAFHDPDAALQLADGLKGVFVQDKVRTALEEAKFGRYARFDNFESASSARHTVGQHGGTPLVNGAAQNVVYDTVKDNYQQNLVTDGWTASVTGLLNEGDVFTIAGVFAVNPGTRQSTGRLQDFVVRSDTNSDGSGNATIAVSPPIITSGAYQTVDAAPADNAAITVVSGAARQQYGQSLAMHRDTLALVMKPFAKPESATVFETRSSDGFSLTYSKGWDVKTFKEVARMDILYGTEAIHPAMGARLTS